MPKQYYYVVRTVRGDLLQAFLNRAADSGYELEMILNGRWDAQADLQYFTVVASIDYRSKPTHMLDDIGDDWDKPA